MFGLKLDHSGQLYLISYLKLESLNRKKSGIYQIRLAMGSIDKSSTSYLTMLLPILLRYGLVCYNFRTDGALGKRGVCLLISRLFPAGSPQ